MKIGTLGLLAASLLTLPSGCAVLKPSAGRQYKAVNGYADGPHVQRQINDMAQQGWHFVSISTAGGDATHWPDAVLVFKKHK